jgi:hypothetical protein
MSLVNHLKKMETERAQLRNLTDSQSTREPSAFSQRKPIKWPAALYLFRRSTVWWPTWFGAFWIVALLLVPAIWWFNSGESFLSLTQRAPAEVLVVEGWIGRQGIHAAVAEFEQRGYRYIVATGGLSSGFWEDEPTSYAKMAAAEMIRSGIPKDKVIVAQADYTERHRTFESAVSVRRAIEAASIQPRAINVFTFGPHARRSGLVFAKLAWLGTEVGVIGWTPPEYQAEPWWRSSERAREVLEETVGFLYEALLNSGRYSTSSVQHASPNFTGHPDAS